MKSLIGLIILSLYSNSLLAAECDIDLTLEHFINGEYETAAQYAIPCAENGDVDAQAILGDYYFYEEQNYEAAFQWLEKSSKQGDPYSFFMLGLMYENGYYVEKNHTAAIEYYEIAANEGITEAKFNLGYIYGVAGWGSSLKRDYKVAAKWFEEAANDGDPDAAYNLYIIYSNGWVSGNPDEWLQIAADLGNEEAISQLNEKNKTLDIEKRLQEMIDDYSTSQQ